MAETLTTLKARRRCRAHKPDAIEESKLNTIIEAGTYAATGMGKQSPIMNIGRSLKRMDSMMVAANIKKLSRLELLYVTVSNLAEEVYRRENKLPEKLKHYMESVDRNLVIYHNKSDETEDNSERIFFFLRKIA